MLAPIRCIIEMSNSLLGRIQDSSLSFDLTVIFNTASFLLNQVQSNLDVSLLDQNKLQVKLGSFNLKSEVIQPVIDIFSAQAKTQQLTLVLEYDMPEVKVEIDKMRT